MESEVADACECETTEQEAPQWERLPNESQRAYDAFVSYRDLRSDRSLIKAYRLRPGFSAATKVSGQYVEWSVQYRWKIRAERYDGYIERQLRLEKESEYRQDLEHFRERQRTLSAASVTVATRMLLKASKRLDNLTDEQAAEMDLRLLPTWVRAAAAIAAAATDAEAQALAVSELLSLLDSQGVAQ